MKNAAAHVIEKCGGPSVVAEMLGLHVTQPYRWTYPKCRGGTDGIIPAKHQQKLLVAAVDRGIELRPDDFFDEALADGDAA